MSTIVRGVTQNFEDELLEQRIAAGTWKFALYAPTAVLSPQTASYTSTGEVQSWSEYPAGGVAVSPQVVRDADGAHVDIADFSFTAMPTDRVIRGGLLYDAAEANNNAALVLNFGQDYSTPNGKLTVELSNATLGRPLIRIHTG